MSYVRAENGKLVWQEPEGGVTPPTTTPAVTTTPPSGAAQNNVGGKTETDPTEGVNVGAVNPAGISNNAMAGQTIPGDERVTPDEVNDIGTGRFLAGAQREYDDARSNYDYWTDIVNMADKPLDAKERERRERTAGAVGSIGAFGNVANAFSNLVWTGMGAPSQTLPDRPDFDKAIDKFRDDERKKGQMFLENAGKKLAMAKAERDYYESKQRYEQELELKKKESAYRLKKLEADYQNALARGQTERAKAIKAQYDAITAQVTAAYAPQVEQGKVDRNAADIKRIKAQTSSIWTNAAKSRAGMEVEVPLSDGSMITIPKKAWNESVMGKILSDAGSPIIIEESYFDPITSTTKSKSRPMRLSEMAQRIGQLLSDGSTQQKSAIERGLRAASGNKPKVPKNPLARTSGGETDW